MNALPTAPAADPSQPVDEAQTTAPPSIRHRLARAMLIGSLLCGAAVSVAVWLAVQEEVDELLDDTLVASAEVLAGVLPANAVHADVSASQSSERFAWQVVDATSQVHLHSARAPALPLSDSRATGFFNTASWRVYGSTLGSDGRILYVAQTRAERTEAQVEVAMSSVLAALGIGLLGYFWLRARLRHELAPVERLSQRLATHEPLAAGATLGPAERAELDTVHRAIDRLGHRLSQRMAHERAFTAHAAHALRTPLAGIDAQLALCLREPTGTLQPHLERAREATGRLQRVLVALLTLFRSGSEPKREAVDVALLLHQAPIPRLQVELRTATPLNADPDLLLAALANLLDNARSHGASRVTVSMPAPQVLRLDDDGPGVTAERRHALAAALDAQAYEGVPGLGLTLADLVARAHGGRLSLPEPAQGCGFAVALLLSADSAEPRAAMNPNKRSS